MSFNYATQHAIILLARCSLFVFCRNLLLGSLYKDLRSLSYTHPGVPVSNQAGTAHDSDEELELSSLPTTSARNTALRMLPSVPSANSITSLTSRIFVSPGGDSSFQSSLAQTGFSLCFEEGCFLFLLVMCQAVDLFDAGTRYVQWRVSLFFLVFLVIIAIPLFQCFLFTYRENTWHKLKLKMRLALTLAPFLLYLFAFSYVPLPQHMENTGFFTHALARMTVLGTLILGLLSGFGAVSTAWSFQPFFGKSNFVTDKDISSAVAALERVHHDLAQRLNDPRLAEVPEPSSSWFPTGLFKGSSGPSALLQEIEGLRVLESQMSRNVEAMHARRNEHQFRKSWKGRIWTLIGRSFAFYCVIRIISSIRNVLFGPTAQNNGTSSPDIITYLLARFVALFPHVPLRAEEVASLSRQISLLLVGCIILSSVRAILWQVGRLVKASSRTIGAAFLLLLLAQLMSTYLLSTLIQLRTSFPPDPEHSSAPEDSTTEALHSFSSTNLFASLPEYQLFGTLFDAAFLAAAALTIGALWIHGQLNQAEVFT